ncbi:MAG TPA: RNA polymerase sigma factor [Acidisoma sp.]|jgi:RNA polymerase sigma-70 factor (ECF subfamily)|uniref:RNA polymerase sigma factor n=1 Tax=Acidisoma sp. TaxID=1872115 RepID=UPI002C112C47|nr:RNA polymerase sigma factor [Acidisoma sp.]HTI01083.1 RNA polymerase sigma factor [Acidisoma sp.]
MTPVDPTRSQFRAMALPLLSYLHRLALALTGNKPRAEDLVQETYVRALTYFPSYQGGDFKAWMAAIMRNLHVNSRTRSPPMEDEEYLAQLPDEAPDPEQVAIVSDRARRLRALIADLPDGLREILILRDFGDLSYAQIAETLAIPAGTVMSRLARARERLRKAWINDGQPT